MKYRHIRWAVFIKFRHYKQWRLIDETIDTDFRVSIAKFNEPDDPDHYGRLKRQGYAKIDKIYVEDTK